MPVKDQLCHRDAKLKDEANKIELLQADLAQLRTVYSVVYTFRIP